MHEDNSIIKGHVLLVDDEQETCVFLEDGLRRHGFDVCSSTTRETALASLDAQDFDAVIADIQLGPDNGLDLCGQIVARRPDLPVVVITGFGSMETAIGAIRAGAYDFAPKPIDIEALVLTLDRAVRHYHMNQELQRLRDGGETQPFAGMIGESTAMRRLYQLLQRFGASDAPVLIRGESGTGKELVARAVHAGSRYAAGPFVGVNCAAVPATLLESTLFGHVKGAFTDAKSSRKGLFVTADGGTLFLDEIGDMPLDMQSKLLRALQERAIRPIGSSVELPFDTRIVSATNRNLEDAVKEGTFREDLYYRLNVVTVHVPPLRERRADILLLAQHFIQTIAQRTGRDVTGLTPEAARMLVDYDWPGNVRQLENVMERAVALTRFDKLTVDDLPTRIAHPNPEFNAEPDPERMLTADEVERRYVERVLQVTGGNKAHAARVLGFDRRTLYRKLARWQKRSEA